MCRLAFYLGPPLTLSQLVTDPEHSIIQQSYHAREREEPLNGDGYGLGWSNHPVSARPAVLREVQPAWSSLNLSGLAGATESDCILAHVRAASPGIGVSQANCHPFAAGRLAFMHNGLVAGYQRIRRELKERLSDRCYDLIAGSTDSEVLFASIIEHLGDPNSEVRLEAMADALEAVIGLVEETAQRAGSRETAHLNLVLTDGAQAVVSRYGTPNGVRSQSLYHHLGGRYRCRNGVCEMLDDPESKTVLFASEPLSADPGWEPVPENHLLLVDAEHNVTSRAIKPVRLL